MTLPLPRLRAVVLLHKIKQAVDQGAKQLALPFAVTLKAPSGGADGLPGAGAAKGDDAQDLHVQPN